MWARMSVRTPAIWRSSSITGFGPVVNRFLEQTADSRTSSITSGERVMRGMLRAGGDTWQGIFLASLP